MYVPPVVRQLWDPEARRLIREAHDNLRRTMEDIAWEVGPAGLAIIVAAACVFFAVGIIALAKVVSLIISLVRVSVG